MNKNYLSCLFLTALFFFSQNVTITAQFVVECDNCPLDFMDNAVDGILTTDIEIADQAVDDLGVTPLISACFDITHDWLSDVFIVLESPGGKSYFLMGDENNNSGGCGDVAYSANVCFVLGDDMPLTNGASYSSMCGGGSVCLEGDWTVACGPSMVSDMMPNSTVTPTCNLDDFNAEGDPVNGTWRASLGCVCGIGEQATLNSWSLEFQVPSLLPCPGPQTTDAKLVHQPCENDDLAFEASNAVEYIWTGPNNFESDQANISLPGFSDYTAGLYSLKAVTAEECYDLHQFEVKNVCQKEDVSIQQGFDQTVCVDQLLSAGFCNELSSGILDIEVVDNCLQITGLSPGIDSVYLWDNVGEEEVYHRFVVEIEAVSKTYETFPVGWHLSPNPSSGIVVLRTPGVLPTEITVVDLQGVTKQAVRPQTGKTELNLESLANGFYIVQVKSNEVTYYERVAVAK